MLQQEQGAGMVLRSPPSIRVYINFSVDQLSLSSTLTVASPRGADALYHSVNQEVMQRLGSIVPWKKLIHPPNIHSSSRTATALSILMPEEYEGQHHNLSNKLCESKQTSLDRLKLELFLLSNNLSSHDLSGKPEWSMKLDDKRVMEMFLLSGWNSVKHLEILLSTIEPTAGAIAEKLFASALRLFDMNTVEMMLKAGMNPNGPIETISHGALTPLQFSAYVKNMDLMKLLLFYGADVNISYNGKSAFQYAIKHKSEQAARALLSYGAIITPACLAAAAAENNTSIDLFSIIISACSDVNAQSGWQDASALAHAVLAEKVEIIKLLLTKGADVSALVDIDFDEDWGITTVLGLGVKSQKLEIIEPLLQACMSVNPEVNGLPYVSPLALAVKTSNIEITELLLKAGVDIQVADDGWKMTLVELATKNRDVELCRLLMKYGAKVDRPLSDGEQTSSALLVAVEKNRSEIVDLLVKMGARLNDVYSRAPGTVLGAAIEKGNPELIQILGDAGATVIGPKIQRIGNVDTAIYLQQRGALQNILQTCGYSILTAALLARDNALVQYLLDHEVNVENQTANIEGSDSKKTPLGAAINTRNLLVAEVILDRGAKVTDSDLVEAVYDILKGESDTKFLRRLLTDFIGSAPSTVGITLIHDQHLLRLILEAGIDPTGVPQLFQNSWDLTHFDQLYGLYDSDDSNDFDDSDDFHLGPPESVLEIAAREGDRPALQILLQFASWDQRLTGRAFAIAILLHHDELVEDLLDFRADVNQEITIVYPEGEDENGEVVTPLQAAVKDQRVSLARRLAECADINYLGKGARRRTALQHAVENGNMELVNMLLDLGADINGAPAIDGGATALQIAAIRGYLGIARKLVDMGADINAAPSRFNGRTALEGAAEHGRIDMLQMLLNDGALIVGDGERQYQRAVGFAKKNGHNAAARLLESFKPQTQSSSP